MTRHLPPGTIVTIRDRGLVDADARRHVEECGTCGAALADARARSAGVEDALEALGVDLRIDVARSKAEVRRRLDERREAAHRRSPRPLWALGRAAVLLLVAGGVAYALPSSPLREWLRPETPAETGDAPVDGAAEAASEGIEVAVPEGGLGIVLRAVSSDASIEVRWLDGPRAAIVAAAGSRYSVSRGRAEVDVAPGAVSIAVPRAGAPITIEANGRIILRRLGDELELAGEVVSRSADRIVFSVGGR